MAEMTLEAIVEWCNTLRSDSPLAKSMLKGNEEVAAKLSKYKAVFRELRDAIGANDMNRLIRTLEREDLTADEKRMVLRIQDKDNSGDTLLHWAGTFGRYDMVDTLIDYGASTKLTNYDGLTASEWTERHMRFVQRTEEAKKPPKNFEQDPAEITKPQVRISETYERIKRRERDRLRVQ